jgi:hypothetical protein
VWGYVNLTSEPSTYNPNAIPPAQCAYLQTMPPNGDLGGIFVGDLLNATHPKPYTLGKNSTIRWIYIYWTYDSTNAGLDQDDQALFWFFQNIPGYRAIFLRGDNQLQLLQSFARNICKYNGAK